MTGTAITLTGCYRGGNRPMIMLGSAVNLTSTTYYYRRIAEYGTTYSGRATDTISGGGTRSPATCAKGARCVAL